MGHHSGQSERKLLKERERKVLDRGQKRDKRNYKTYENRSISAFLI